MPPRSFRRLLVLVSLLLLPISAYAQEAAISGTITDATGGVLPGVVVRAVNDATGNSFEAVTDSTGKYRITVRIGGYRMAAELAGFATVERGGVQVQVGQQAVLNLQMAPADGAGVGDGDRRSAAGRHHAVEPGKQHRRAAGAGPAGQRPQLHGPDAAGRRQPSELRGGNAGGELSAERRRPAGDAADRDQLRPAALQQGHDRGVRGDHEPVRRAAGPLDRHPGQRRSRSPAPTRRPDRLPATSATTSSTPPTSSRRRCCRTPTSS